MTQQYEIGQPVKFRLYNKKGKATWFDGVIHGVRRYEDPATNAIIKITYIVDTLENETVDEHPYSPRDREIMSRVRKLQKTGMDVDAAAERVFKHTDLPGREIKIETVRQPQQVELAQEHIKAV